MKQTAILLTLALAIGAGSVLQTFAAEKIEKKETEIGKVMKKHFKGDTSDVKKGIKGELNKEQTAALLAAVKTLGAAKPPKGEDASWKEKTGLLVTALEKLDKGEANAGAELKIAADCKGCHKAHRED